MSNLIKHAKREFLLAGYADPTKPETEDDPNKWIQQNVLELLEVFSKQGHSGLSAPYCIGIFKTLASFEILTPLTYEDDEWLDRSEESGEPCWQNIRASAIFKGADGRAYDSNGRVFRYPSGVCYTSSDSRVYVEFPYTPKIEYVDVDADGFPLLK